MKTPVNKKRVDKLCIDKEILKFFPKASRMAHPVPTQWEKSSAHERWDGSPLPDKDKGKNPAAVALGKLGGAKGGKARAESLTAERRSAIARLAAKRRWSGSKGRVNESGVSNE